MSSEEKKGLYCKYLISHTDGTPVNPKNEYFILKLKGEGDPIHIEASRKAAATYADAIESHLPKLAKDLRERYSL